MDTTPALKVWVAPLAAPRPDRDNAQDILVIKRFVARKLCGSLATGALFSGWKTDTLAQKMALLRLESILIYNLLDLGYRVGNNSTQAAAITDSIKWHVSVYKRVYPLAVTQQHPNPINPATYEACLKEMCKFRLTRFGVKTPKTAAHNDAVVYTSLNNVGVAAWITQAIFLQSCFMRKSADDTFDLHDLDVDEVDVHQLLIGVKAAWEQIAHLEEVQIPPSGDPISNEDIRLATRAVLTAFSPPAVDGNTFLTAGRPHRGDMFRLCCRCIMVMSYVCHTNNEPPVGDARNVWLNLKHFNFLDTVTAVPVSGSHHVYSLQDHFDEHGYLETIDRAFPDAMM